eukprot:Phypoly_transcript_05623.p1 GENE.Phypoly_transcript_05623~~Phypoly_transcript_05623.p1  ORF type:complete len:390 (+),score=50.01 Phypoly_transcript_05623:16-1185(+)
MLLSQGRMKYFVCLILLLSALILAEGSVVSRTPSHQHKKSLTDPAPSTGNHKVLVLAVEYPSQRGQYTGSKWKSDFFSLWGQFYQTQSYGTLLYEIDVVTVNSAGNPVVNDPTSTSYIPLPNEISVYANGQHGWAFDTKWNLHAVVRDASTYLDSKNFDWSPYIENGKVLNVIIMSAGTDYRYAQSVVPNADSNYLLSTSYSGVYYTTKNGASLNSYTFCSEHTQDVGSTPLVMAHIGQCAHEFGHALGVPDLYDLSSQTTGVGYFDLLGYGVYADNNEDGATPVGFGAFPKTQFGWAKPTIITYEQQIDLAASSLAAGNFLKIYPNESDTSFYYLVENRQPLDTYDNNFVKQYVSGVLIWRVNETAVTEYTVANHINTYPSKSLDSFA